jgi:hypothetical protein
MFHVTSSLIQLSHILCNFLPHTVFTYFTLLLPSCNSHIFHVTSCLIQYSHILRHFFPHTILTYFMLLFLIGESDANMEGIISSDPERGDGLHCVCCTVCAALCVLHCVYSTVCAALKYVRIVQYSLIFHNM